MKLQVGERLSGSGPPQQPGGYVVTEVVGETPWHGLYAGKRILYNFDFTGQASARNRRVEWLDVLLRTIRYPYLDDADYVARRRTQARTEVRRVLGSGGSNLWPQPIDLLEIANSRDAFAFPQARRTSSRSRSWPGRTGSCWPIGSVKPGLSRPRSPCWPSCWSSSIRSIRTVSCCTAWARRRS